MFRNPEESATSAVLALLLEVSSTPKAGNVDREHDFEDLKFEHFLTSAVSAFPFFLKTAKEKRLHLLQAVIAGKNFGINTNVHFGAFLLLFPLVAVWESESAVVAGKNATNFLKSTTHFESLEILKAFQLCKPRVLETKEMSLKCNSTANEILRKRMNVYEWMKLAPKENLIAFEITNGYPRSVEGASLLLSSNDRANDAIVLLYHRMLASYPDTLIISKFGIEKALEVMSLAKKAIEAKDFNEFRRLDEFLLKNRLNPGTIADLTASSIYLAFLEGWKVEA
ncbi:MAG: triphosphoribosyl-dephospho-CoA synthase [Archaeoglobaceae archaeon]